MSNKRYDAYGHEFELTEKDFELTQADQKIHDVKFETKATTYTKDAFKRFCKNKSSVVGAIIIGILLLLSFILPIVSSCPIDSKNPNVKEKEQLPKLFDYKPSGYVDTSVEKSEYKWSTFWNGTVIRNKVMYDFDTGRPYIEENGQRVYYPEAAVKELEWYGTETNRTGAGVANGTYILRDTSSTRSNPIIQVYTPLDYTDSENFTIKVVFEQEDIHFENLFQEFNATAKGEYRIIVRYGACDANRKYSNENNFILVKDWSTDYSDVNVNVSEIMKSNNISKIENANVFIEMKKNKSELCYIAVKELILTSDDNNPVNIYGDTYNKGDALRAMSLSNSLDNYDDVATKFRYVKADTGKFPINYWQAYKDTNKLYKGYIYNCDILLDTYEVTYGLKETKEVTLAKLTEYKNKGWCDFTYIPEENVFEFTKLSDECPVDSINYDNTTITLLDNGKYALQISCNIYNYRFLGYDEVPNYLFGTDKNGFDIVIFSFNSLKYSFLLSILISAVCLSFGLVWGSISGYFGGTVDLLMERFCEILSGVPSTVVITLVVLLMNDNTVAFILSLCMTGWLGMAGRTRTQFYRFKGREYILASRTLGSSDMRLIFKHILPNSLGTIVTGSVLSIPSVIFSEASLAYLGILSTSNSFGSILSGNQIYISSLPMLIVFPSVIISLIMISFNLFGNGLRDALNPSLKGSE